MNYHSTRDPAAVVRSGEAITQGISKEGGLFVPASLPVFAGESIEAMADLSYEERACRVLKGLLTDYSTEELRGCVHRAYGSGFDHADIAPVVQLDEGTYLLELWHGPTCAFKDMALQLLPHLLTAAVEKTADQKEVAILVATSGDTGKAALEGFRDVPGTRILVFYPADGVSQMQQLQMLTQEGDNVGVCGVRGNFDDTQSAVKKIFTDPVLGRLLAEQDMMFSSANSINWGRLAPQIVYYFSAYCDLVKQGEIAMGEKVNVAVPTGNFGNILAAYYAKTMGLPIARLICASNVNNVLTDFIRTGVYDRRRAFHQTQSPSMDILISSNLERLLHGLYKAQGEGAEQAVADLMKALDESGVYTVSEPVRQALQQSFYGGFCDEQTTRDTIRETYVDAEYLLDPHTAVAVSVREQYRRESGDNTKTIVTSTASPFKFSETILYALQGIPGGAGGFAQAQELSMLTKNPIPAPLMALRKKHIRFDTTIDSAEMERWTRRQLGV